MAVNVILVLYSAVCIRPSILDYGVGSGSRATHINYFLSFGQLCVCYGMLIEMISGLVKSTFMIGVLSSSLIVVV